jgi:hypothetical protein
MVEPRFIPLLVDLGYRRLVLPAADMGEANGLVTSSRVTIGKRSAELP